MKDFVSFLLRGALGAIIGGTIFALLLSLYTSYFLILWWALTPVFLAIEGAFGIVVALVCWVAADDVHGLNKLIRVAIGTEMMWDALLAPYVYQFINRGDKPTNFSILDVFYFQFFLLAVPLAIGGVAVLACPS